jgi:uroporphyrinogen decarboxylase
MNMRQRFRETLLFGNPDKMPLSLGGPRESTMKAWIRQGLPADRPYTETLADILGIPAEAFLTTTFLGVNTRMIPAYEPVILDHRDGHYLIRDHMGATVEIADTFDPTYLMQAKDFVTRKWHKFPVENRDDWLEMKKRYDPEDPGRFPLDFAGQEALLKNRDTLAALYFNGPFWQLREWCGFENLCIMMVEDPELVQEMAGFWAAFMAEMLKKICARVELDYVTIAEDMAYKAHSMISPGMTREFIQGGYRAWVPILKASGCPVIELDSDGCVDDLLPIWIESGINCNSPVEVAAHCDILAYRRQYGKSMSFKQGIDKRIMARGGRELEQHVKAIVPEMFKLGGYIPGCDHGVPPDISWKNYVDFGRLIARLSGWL